MRKLELVPGIYEQVVNRYFAGELSGVEAGRALVEPMEPDSDVSAAILAGYLAAVLRHGLEACRDSEGGEPADAAARMAEQCRLANRVIEMVRQETGNNDLLDYLLDDTHPRQLLSLLPKGAVIARDGRLERPRTSLSRATLFTGDQGEAPLDGELRREILSCDRVDLCVSFIKMSGLRLLLPALEKFLARGGDHRLRVLCTTYTGATDVRAVDRLAALGSGVEVRVSYDSEKTRMHAKAYIFHRASHFSTAYVGSSNISVSAITRGLEWNLKVAEQEQPDLFDKVAAGFESSWNSPSFVAYTPDQHDRLARALRDGLGGTGRDGPLPFYSFDIRPLPYQQGMLDAIEADRKIHGLDRSLVVAATGTGKTVVAALDYRRFREERHRDHQPARLLFVAHRREILEQAMACFRGVLRDENFGELMVGGSTPRDRGDLFMSIQTFNSQAWKDKVAPDWYQYIVVDEVHHGPARSYGPLFATMRPAFWLGLTATPERLDARDVTSFFNGRLSFELRMPEAVEGEHLCPFQYFLVTDSVDYSHLSWRAGHYDTAELERVYTMDQAAALRRASLVVDALDRYLADPRDARCVGFCVSVRHARYMADYFAGIGLPAKALTAESGGEERSRAIADFRAGSTRYLFVVDLFNEGVDIPAIDTILFLRPTESLTVFLQQLGRGLRKSKGKECLTVLDFVGRAHKNYRMGEKLEALLLPNHRMDIASCAREHFPDVPRGCSIQMEPVAMDYILQNLSRVSVNTIAARVREYAERKGTPTLAGFLRDQGMEAAELYRHGTSFARLCARAGVRQDFHEPDEKLVERVLPRLCAINSRRWLSFLIELLPVLGRLSPPMGDAPAAQEARRFLQMTYFTFWQELPGSGEGDAGNAMCARLRALARNPVLMGELGELFAWSLNRIRFVDSRCDLGFPCPLDAHCAYTRDQILAAMDYLRPSGMRQGVLYLRERKIDIFLVTLEKSEKFFSPTTSYRDYAMGETLFHWESQSTTSADSPTARRYINHRATGNRILLFVRDRKKGRWGETMPYIFLGLASHVSHSGSRPVSFVWKLDRPMPASFVDVANKMTA